MTEMTIRPSLFESIRGRYFVNPAFDYLVIGGALSLLVTAIVATRPAGASVFSDSAMGTIVLFSNAAHFAASTVRLYTKPGAAAAMPFLSRILPGIAILIMTLGVAWASNVGNFLNLVYLTWSPYHYGAQAYGLSVMYSYRSGCMLKPLDKRLLWWVSMIPFFYMAPHVLNTGLPESVRALFPDLAPYRSVIRAVVVPAGLLLPVVLYARVWRGSGGPMPLISLLTVVTNGLWFFVLDPMQAFVWATIFHGLQYLAIVIIFDVRDRMALPGNTYGRTFHALWFYGMSLGLGYVLFMLLPLAYRILGFDYANGQLASIAVINIHHFIVDAYIWRLGKGDGNRRIVEGIG